jgi:F-type H+-transporting ATPase subunit epsilon
MRCLVVTPEKTVLDTEADFIVVPLYDGEYGIAPDHTPLVGRLGNGELRVRKGGETISYYVSGGFVEVLDDLVSLLPNQAQPISELDPEAIRPKFEAALQLPMRTPEEAAIRNRDVSRYRAQLHLATKAGQK